MFKIYIYTLLVCLFVSNKDKMFTIEIKDRREAPQKPSLNLYLYSEILVLTPPRQSLLSKNIFGDNSAIPTSDI